VHKLRSFFCAKGKANVLYLSSRGSNKLLLTRLVVDSTASKLKEIARGRFTILCVSKGRVAIGVEAKVAISV
jgi:hypothetical protein